jgi:hypothetical protein
MAKGKMSKIIMVSCRIAQGNIGKGRIPKGRTAKDWMEHFSITLRSTRLMLTYF